MHFYLTGLDYKSAPINARERIYRRHKDISTFWQGCNGPASAVLVTCNRIEIYGATKYPDDAFSDISVFFKAFPDFAKYAYTVHGRKDVLSHAVSLAAGLKSQVRGELQILRQIENWISADTFPVPLKILWDEAILLSHDLRKKAGFYDERNNIAAFIFKDIKKRLLQKEKYELIVIGTGKIAELLAKYRPQGVCLNFAAHKNFNKARILAASAQGEVLRLEDMPKLIASADAIIIATKSPHYALKKKHFDNISINSLYIYDLSLPLGVDPEVRSLPGVFLYNLDDLDYLFKERHAWSRVSG